MPDKGKWTHDDLLAGRVPTLSFVNEPIDYSVDYIVEKTAGERPKLRLVVNNEHMKEPNQ
jgi:hypothetical protein